MDLPRARLGLALAAGVLILAAQSSCAAGSGSEPPVRAGLPALPSASTTCPFGFRGTRVRIDDTALGADVTLVAYGDVAELRRRARDAAAMHGPGAHLGLGHHGAHESGQHHGLGLAQLGVPVRATEEDVADGARVHVAALEPSDAARVRVALRERAERTRVGECP